MKIITFALLALIAACASSPPPYHTPVVVAPAPVVAPKVEPKAVPKAEAPKEATKAEPKAKPVAPVKTDDCKKDDDKHVSDKADCKKKGAESGDKGKTDGKEHGEH